MTDYIKVADVDNLVRDPVSGAILNTDVAGYQSYVQRRQKLQAQKQQMQYQQDTINTLTQDVTELKMMMQTLISSLKDSTRG